MKRITQLTQTLPADTVYDTMDSPVGMLLLFASDKGIHSILWEDEANTDSCKVLLKKLQRDPQHPVIMQAKQELKDYFDGKCQQFTVPVCLAGTAFQRQAWQALCEIPYGQTISYGEQARRLGDKNKARAVGLANGSNPVPVIVPCHRVIGSGGKLTGFGGGLNNKALLLGLEMRGCRSILTES